jgi:probable HAF family extracellular repeat protein
MGRLREVGQLNIHAVVLLMIVLAVGAFSMVGCGDGGGSSGGRSNVIILPPIAEGGLLYPEAISADGSSVVGYGENASGKLEAFRWTSKEGTVGLGFLPGYTDGSNAASVSGDGSVIVGMSINDASQSGNAWVWTERAEMQAIPMPEEALGSQAIQITEDGKYVLGAYTRVDGVAFGFIWSEKGGAQTIRVSDSTPPDEFAPVGITGDGLNVFFNRVTEAAGITQGGVLHQYGLPFGQGEWGGYNLTPADSVDVFFVRNGAVSRDGGTVAGFIERKDHWVTPGIWLAQGSVLQIAPGVIGRTKCVSPDGSMAGGGNGDMGSAFIWDKQAGHRNLVVHLQALDEELGTQYLDAFETTGGPADVTGIAADNKRLVGTAGQVALSDYWATFLLDLP